MTLRQQWVLNCVREFPGLTIKQIAEKSPISEKKSAEWNERGRRPADGEQWEVPVFDYATVQVALARLRKLGLVRREPEERRPNGTPYFHFPAADPEPPEDELEKAFLAPSAEVKH